MFNSFRRPSSSGVPSASSSSRPSTPTTAATVGDPALQSIAPLPPSMCPPESTSLRCLVCQQDPSSSGAKLPLYDSILAAHPSATANGVGPTGTTTSNNRPRRLHSPQLELIAQMMFGATPLSHKGRSTKLHEVRLPASALYPVPTPGHHQHPSHQQGPVPAAQSSASAPPPLHGAGMNVAAMTMATASQSSFACQHATEPPSTTAPNAILVTSLFSISLAHLDHSIRTKLSASSANPSDPSSLATSYASSLVGLVPTVLSSPSSNVPSGITSNAQSVFDLSSIPMDQLKLAARRLTRSMYAIGLILPCACPRFRQFVLSQLATIERLMLRVQAHVSRLVLSEFIHSWQPGNASSSVVGGGGRGPLSSSARRTPASIKGPEIRYSMQDTLALAIDDLRAEIVRIYLALSTPSGSPALQLVYHPTPPTPTLNRRISMMSMSSTRSSILEEGARRASLAPRSESDVLLVPPPSSLLNATVAVLLTCTRKWFTWALGAPGMDVQMLDQQVPGGDVDADFRVVVVGSGNEKEAAGWIEVIGLLMDPPTEERQQHSRSNTGIGEEEDEEDEQHGGASVTLAGGLSTSTIVTEIGPAADSYPFVSATQAPKYPGPLSTSCPVDPTPADTPTPPASRHFLFLASLPLQSLPAPLSPHDYLRIRLEAAESIAIQGFSPATLPSATDSRDGCSAASPIWADLDRPCTLLIVDTHEHRLLLVTARAFDETRGDATVHAISPWEHLWTTFSSTTDSSEGPLVLTGLGPAGRAVYTNIVRVPLTDAAVPPVVAQLVASLFLSAVQFDRATAVAHCRQVLGQAVASRVVACAVLALGKEEGNPVVGEQDRVVPIKAWGSSAAAVDEDDGEEEEVGVGVVADLLGCNVRDVGLVRYLRGQLMG